MDTNLPGIMARNCKKDYPSYSIYRSLIFAREIRVGISRSRREIFTGGRRCGAGPRLPGPRIDLVLGLEITTSFCSLLVYLPLVLKFSVSGPAYSTSPS